MSCDTIKFINIAFLTLTFNKLRMEEQLLLTEDDIVAENTSSSSISPKEHTVSEENQSFSTLKNKFEGISALAKSFLISSKKLTYLNSWEDIIKGFKLQDSASISVVSFIGFSQSETTSNLHSIANAIVEKNVFGQV